MSTEVETKPSETAETTKTADEVEDSKEAPVTAVNLLAQGKRNLVCGEIPTAVNELQEACGLLAATYGETAKECGEVYFYYGQALLELARMETGVLGNALQGVPEDTEDESEANDEQFEKADKCTGEELEKIRDDVYDAMAEKKEEKEKTENGDVKKEENGEKKAEGESMETEEYKENVPEKDAEKTDGGKKPLEEKTDEEIKNEKNIDLSDKSDQKGEKAKTEDTKVDEQEGKLKESGEEGKLKESGEGGLKQNGEKINASTEDVIDGNKTSVTEDETAKGEKETESIEIQKDQAETTENDDEAMEVTAESKDKEGEEKGDEKVEGKGEEGEGKGEDEGEEECEDEEGEGTAEEEETDPGEGQSSGAKGEEDPDDISNLQLSWEMLELAKVIYLKQEDKEMKLKAAQAYLKLGEVSLETEQYDQAISDINECLKIQKEYLEDDRLLAETHYQLGLAYSFNKNCEQAIDSFRGAIKIIEEKISKLKSDQEKALDKKDEKENLCEALEKEIKELGEILPDIRAKIEDVLEEQKNMEEIKTMAKDACTTQFTESTSSSIGTEPSTTASETKASDISHLIRKKRKPEEDISEEAETKKSRQDEDGSGDASEAKSKQNGFHESPDKQKEVVSDRKETDSNNVTMAPAETVVST